MGSRFSNRASTNTSRDDNEMHNNKAASDAVGLKLARSEFQSQIKKLLTKKNPSAGHLRLDIKGQIEKYPFWISKTDLKKENGGKKDVEYGTLNPEKVIVPCPPKLPNNLHCHLNKTIRLALKHKKSSISDMKQELYPEHDIILKCVTKLILKVNIVEDGCQSQLKFQIFEQHRNFKTGRRPMHMREMKVERVIFDQHNNMAITGQEFALIIYKMDMEQERITESSLQISGEYIRILDTCPSAVMIFHYEDTGNTGDVIPASTSTHNDEYAKRLLSKSSAYPFRIKLSRSKSHKSKNG